MLQLYLHQFVRQNINIQLKYTYNNKITKKDLQVEKIAILEDKNPTIADAMQILILSYNIGHFYNTFSASRAVVLAAFENKQLRNNILSYFKNPKIKDIVTSIFEQRNYQQFHLVNSLIILQSCDQGKSSVKFAQVLICRYMENYSDIDEKLCYIYKIFKRIRSFSYFIYDLPISKNPLYLDVRDKGALRNILSEMLNQYNNHQTINDLFKSIAKILDDTIYNENSLGIALYQVSQDMKKKINLKDWMQENYKTMIDDKDSIFNCNYPQHFNFDKSNILKITFDVKDEINIFGLFNELAKMNFVKVGYYDRNGSSKKTILVSIKNNCTKQTQVAFRILKKILTHMQKCNEIETTDSRYILVVKYFLYYLLGESLIQINQTIDDVICMFVCRGKKARIKILDKLLENQYGTVDERHEAKFIRNILSKESKNDTAIVICSSIVAYDKIQIGKKQYELDGLIIFPFRSNNQIVFLESKNTKEKPKFAKKCLVKKFKNMPIEVNIKDIITDHHDCYYRHSI